PHSSHSSENTSSPQNSTTALSTPQKKQPKKNSPSSTSSSHVLTAAPFQDQSSPNTYETQPTKNKSSSQDAPTTNSPKNKSGSQAPTCSSPSPSPRTRCCAHLESFSSLNGPRKHSKLSAQGSTWTPSTHFAMNYLDSASSSTNTSALTTP